LNQLFALLFAAFGIYHIWRSASALRTGKLVWRFWWSSRTAYRDDDISGFNGALALNTATGFGFLALAAGAVSV
jgi:hypothetical protein